MGYEQGLQRDCLKMSETSVGVLESGGGAFEDVILLTCSLETRPLVNG